MLAKGVKGGQQNNWFLYITPVFHVIHSIAIFFFRFHMPHLHLRAPFIMISCSLAHIQLVNLFALDQRKFPRGYTPPHPSLQQPSTPALPYLLMSKNMNQSAFVSLSRAVFIYFHQWEMPLYVYPQVTLPCSTQKSKNDHCILCQRAEEMIEHIVCRELHELDQRELLRR